MIKIDGDYTDYRDDTDPNYPGGKAIDAPDDESIEATPFKADWMNDTHGFRQAIYKKAFGSLNGVTRSPDNAYASDTLLAIEKLDDNILQNAKGYSDGLVNTEVRARIQGDSDSLNNAKDYTDGQVTAEAQARIQGDGITLTNAKKYTDEQDAFKAPINNPVFTGTVKIPSKASAATSDGTLVATEAQVALKANIASPTFTGTVKVPSKASAAANDGTLVATEAQVYQALQLAASPPRIKSNGGNIDPVTDDADLTMQQVNGAAGAPSSEWYSYITLRYANSMGYFQQLALQMTGGQNLWYRKKEGGGLSGWLHSSCPPIGAYYTQYAGSNNAFSDAENPTTLFGGTWSNPPLWNSDGTYFQTEGGGTMSRSNGSQGDAIRNIKGSVAGARIGTSDNFTADGVLSAAAESGRPRAESASNMNALKITIDTQAGGLPTDIVSHPKNRLIRVWKRTG